MNELDRLRATYGRGTFVTSLPDGTSVPWRPLSIGEYFEYQKILASKPRDSVLIENDIFSRCVVDESLSNNIPSLKAGTIPTVVSNILALSGPHGSPEELNLALDMARHDMNENAFHGWVPLICHVFPAYKPEDVYALDYETFMFRLAQAEGKLMQMGIMTEPIKFSSQGDVEAQKPRPKKIERLLDLRSKFDKEQASQPQKKTIITDLDAREHEMAYTGHEIQDKILIEHEMEKSTSPIYAEYAQQIAEGKKVVIKSTEQRIAEGKARAKQSELNYLEYQKHLKKENEALADLVNQVKVTRSRKKKKRGRL